MRKIFLSYSAEDRPRVALLAERLEAEGFDLWWDQNIPGGNSYARVIEAAINDSDLVIVVWSKASVVSDWVADEASAARDAGKLVPISIDNEAAPIGFRQYQTLDFQADTGETSSHPYRQLLSTIEGYKEGQHKIDAAPPERAAQNNLKGFMRFAPMISIAAALLAAAVLFSKPTPNNDERPLVVVMDSAHPARVYDEDVRDSGSTNADTLSDLLDDLPIRIQKELIFPEWHRDEKIVQFEPDLVIIHYSGFKQEDSSGDRPRLETLIDYFGNSDTEFLIYSRAGEDWVRDRMDTWLADKYAKYDGLRERIHVFGLLDYGEPYWRDPATALSLKLRVKETLEL